MGLPWILALIGPVPKPSKALNFKAGAKAPAFLFLG
jgi:hypothetical protein